MNESNLIEIKHSNDKDCYDINCYNKEDEYEFKYWVYILFYKENLSPDIYFIGIQSPTPMKIVEFKIRLKNEFEKKTSINLNDYKDLFELNCIGRLKVHATDHSFYLKDNWMIIFKPLETWVFLDGFFDKTVKLNRIENIFCPVNHSKNISQNKNLQLKFHEIYKLYEKVNNISNKIHNKTDLQIKPQKERSAPPKKPKIPNGISFF